MAEHWKRMTYFAFALPNRPGELARFAADLDSAQVNLVGLWGYAEGEDLPRLSCVPESPDAFRAFASEGGISFEEGHTLYCIADDERGALRDTLERIADAGINVDAIECTAAGSRFGCFLWAGDEEFARLEALLK